MKKENRAARFDFGASRLIPVIILTLVAFAALAGWWFGIENPHREAEVQAAGQRREEQRRAREERTAAEHQQAEEERKRQNRISQAEKARKQQMRLLQTERENKIRGEAPMP